MFEAMLNVTGPAGTSDLFLIDWREGSGTKTTERASKSVFNVLGSGSLIDDPAMGKCFNNTGGGAFQGDAVYNLINLSLPKWELSIEVTPTSVTNGGTLMSRAFLNSGTGGWYLSFAPSTNGLIEFYWVSGSGSWTRLASTQGLVVGVKAKVRLVRDNNVMSLYINDTFQASFAAPTFNNPSVVLAVGSFADTFSSRTFTGKIGVVRFFIP